MTAKMAAHGRLGNDPRQVQTKTGTEMATALMFCSDTSKSEGVNDLAIGLVAFKNNAGILLKHCKGDLLSISGDVQINEWQQNGETRRQVQVIVQDFVSNKASRPGGRKKTIPGQAKPGDFNNAIPAAFTQEIKP